MVTSSGRNPTTVDRVAPTEVPLEAPDGGERRSAPGLRLPNGAGLPSWAGRALGAAAALTLAVGLVGLLSVDDGTTARTSTEQAADAARAGTGLDRLSPLPDTSTTTPGDSVSVDKPAEVGSSSSALDELILEPFGAPTGLGVPDPGDQDYRRALPSAGGGFPAGSPVGQPGPGAAPTPIVAPTPVPTPGQPAPSSPAAPAPVGGSPTISLGALGGLSLDSSCLGLKLLGTNVGCDPATGEAGLSLLGIPLLP